MNENQPKQSTALPFETKTGFTAVPNAVLMHYSFFPKFNGNVLRIYAYLLKMYNADYGYAFPTQDQSAQALGITDKTFSSSVKVLVECGLVVTRKNKPFNNLVYCFEAPIDDAEEFFDKYPQAAEVKRKKDETWAKITPVREAAKAEFNFEW